MYKCTQNQFTIQVYSKNQFLMQLYTKQVYCAKVQTGWMETDISILIMKGMYRDGILLRNVHGRNITNVSLYANWFFR